MRTPRPLAKDARVRVVSVAGRVEGAAFATGLARLRAEGRVVEVDTDLLDRGHPYLAAPASERAEALLAAFVDPDVDAVWCARGGYGSMHLIGRVDFGLLAETRKAFIGFSDVTALHLGLNRAGLMTVHGPVVTALGAASEADATALLAGVGELLAGGWRAERVLLGEGAASGKATGRLVGGNLSLLAACLPVPGLALPRGCVLLIEDLNEPLYKLDRLVTGLVLAGALDAVGGFAIGSFEGCARGQGGSREAARVVAECLAPLGRPVLLGLPIGHRDADVPILLGGPVTLDADAGRLTWHPVADG